MREDDDCIDMRDLRDRDRERREHAERARRMGGHAWCTMLLARLAAQRAKKKKIRIPGWVIESKSGPRILASAKTGGYEIAIADEAAVAEAYRLRADALTDPGYGPSLRRLMERAGVQNGCD